MGAVYEAEHLHLGKRVALKTLPGAVVGDAGAIERFLREGRAAARVRHPHVVDVTDVGVEDGVPYLVMELLEGEDLAARLRRAPRLDVAEALDLLLPVVAAVDAMHRVGVVHRDLKPENIFLARELGRVVPRVLDFGVARPDALEAATPSARSGLVGTPYYLSPEQIDGARGDARSDQHALAVIAHECLGGARPYEAPTLLELLSRIRDGRRDDLRTLRPDLPAALADAIARAMHPSPADRFESARAFGDALARNASERAVESWRELTADATPGFVSEPAPYGATAPAVTRRDGSPAAPTATPAASPEAILAAPPRPWRPIALAALLALLVGAAAHRWASRAPSTPRLSPRAVTADAATASAAPAPPTAPTAADASASPTTAGPPREPHRAATARRPPRAVAPPSPTTAPSAAPTPTLTPTPPPAEPARREPTQQAPPRAVVNGAPIVD
jgi:serine/threonine-protein kinase